MVLLRGSGERTSAKLNALDLVVTVALGSTLATILLNPAVSWSEGAVALVLLAGLQYVVAAFTSRYPAGTALVTAEPTRLLKDGRFFEAELHQQRLTHSEVRQSIRANRLGDVADVATVILETDGTLSVVPPDKAGDRSALRGAETHGTL